MTKREAKREYGRLARASLYAYDAYVSAGETEEGWKSYRPIREAKNAAFRAAYPLEQRREMKRRRIERYLQEMCAPPSPHPAPSQEESEKVSQTG